MFIVLILVLTIAPFTYKWWPPGKLQDYAVLFDHSEDFLSLYRYSATTNFDAITWCKGDHYNSFNKEGRALTTSEIDSDPEVKKFIIYAETKEAPCFSAHKTDEKWLIHAGKGGFRTELNGRPAMSQISRFYYNSASNNELGCTEHGNVDSKLVSCTQYMFSDWYMLEQTLTYQLQGIKSDDIL
ncbi:hypothetical protein KUL49_14950 [Alteromonas sp. KUL49]|nr:hypothetical protein KUL49_14950 [Alteromonas sp. KUL49]